MTIKLGFILGADFVSVVGGPLVLWVQKQLQAFWPALHRLCCLAGSSWNSRDLFKCFPCNHLWGIGAAESKYQCGQSLCIYPCLSGTVRVQFSVYLCCCHLKHFSWSPDVMRYANVSSETTGRCVCVCVCVCFARVVPVLQNIFNSYKVNYNYYFY